jgi:hypothetical protein
MKIMLVRMIALEEPPASSALRLPDRLYGKPPGVASALGW